jgi:hypothetical protein
MPEASHPINDRASRCRVDPARRRAVGRVNQSVARLSAVSTIFVPLTFIASIYRMNFENMPELSTRFAYFVVL